MFHLEELEKIKEKALIEHIPIIMDDTLEKIREILIQENPTKILEIGTAVGYSASQFVRFAPNASVDTIFLQEGIRLAKNNCIILADNILYKGYVMSDYNKHKQRTAVNHLREYIKMATENENLETEILEVGVGLAISLLKKRFTKYKFFNKMSSQS